MPRHDRRIPHATRRQGRGRPGGYAVRAWAPGAARRVRSRPPADASAPGRWAGPACAWRRFGPSLHHACCRAGIAKMRRVRGRVGLGGAEEGEQEQRSEEHTSELQSLMRNSYAVFCFKKKKKQKKTV